MCVYMLISLEKILHNVDFRHLQISVNYVSSYFFLMGPYICINKIKKKYLEKKKSSQVITFDRWYMIIIKMQGRIGCSDGVFL